ncbi:MAG: hypothetical protein O2954_00130 [bacterium]|nr:hypothetical protein [bacterium]
MALDIADLDLIRKTVQEVVETSQERLAQMVAKQTVAVQDEVRGIQDALRKASSHQAQVEADLADLNRTSEVLRRRVQNIHDHINNMNLPDREFTLRLGHLEREVAEIRQRLAI